MATFKREILATEEALNIPQRRYPDEVVQKELQRLIKNLKHWSQEVAKHHEEIAVRNFAIGMEIRGFIEQFPPRLYSGMDLFGNIASGVGLSPSYLSALANTVSWLYDEQRVHNIRTYMRNNNLSNWTRVVEHYHVNSGKKTRAGVQLARRLLGAKSSLNNFKVLLPKNKRAEIDEMIIRIEELAKSKLKTLRQQNRGE